MLRPSSGCGRRTPRSHRASRCGWPSAPPTCSARGRRRPRRGLDVSGLTGVIEVDPDGRTADVQGMCTYEDLVDATLPHGLIPYVVPQLRTITLGGAVTGLGIESTSFRNGLPARVRARDGRVHRRRRGGHDPARRTTCSTPSPTPTARSATRPGCGSRSSAVPGRVALRHVRFDDPGLLAKTVATVADSGEYDGEPRRRGRRRRVRAGRVLPDASRRWTRTPQPAGADRATTPASRSTTARSSSARPTC